MPIETLPERAKWPANLRFVGPHRGRDGWFYWDRWAVAGFGPFSTRATARDHKAHRRAETPPEEGK